jgi:hypothetical protein
VSAARFQPAEEKNGRDAENQRLENPKKMPNKIQKI